MKDLINSAFLNKTKVQNKYGEYVPAIPEPFYGFLKRCQCNARFFRETAYRGHYALTHILGL